MAEKQTRLQQLQGDVEEVRDVMLKNYNKANERESKLEDLDDRAEDLLKHCKRFEKTTRRVKGKMESENTSVCFRNKKVIAAIAAAVVVVILIAVAIFLSQ